MAITDVPAFAHLTDADIDNLAVELDAIRLDIEDSLGERDARYIRRTIAAQRALDLAGRLMLAGSSKRSAWWAGTVTLSLAKIIENMEIGHNVMHGQWDWMNDPEIHSSTWEWDMSGASKHWKATHNFQHHKYTNILGMDDDVGYSTLRVTRDQPWKAYNLGNLLFNTILALGFEWGIGLQPIEFGKLLEEGPGRETTLRQIREFSTKAGRQLIKDYVAFPALTSVSPAATFTSTLKANIVANVIRNIWTDAVIFCGHFPDGAEKFTKTDMVGESKGAVVFAPDAGQRQLRRRSGDAVHERQPVLPDRASPIPRYTEQSATPDLAARARGVRQVRLAVHHGLIPGAVRQDVAHYRQAVTAGPLLARHRRQRSGDPQRADVHRTSARFRRDRPGHGTPPRAQDGHRGGPAMAPRPAPMNVIYWPVTYGTVGYVIVG